MAGVEITEKKFKAYEAVRSSGVTNMFDVRTVVRLSMGMLDKEDCFEIMKNYEKLMKQYPGVRKGD